ncbi:ABC transporter substrate-binding protein [Oceanicella actignis]|uniref:Putative hydroxymethylpyrimidine transport system substrate-binding protein n=1 Tax=Oceanicella actignis TaxID=1189325 RepID=A0A1M7RTB8_9RHOB|nr:ABC transporter substrate-binding protein [Oceanicella actignis]SET05255.1 putative hydroxymethylpyrimidine transport system substrate-binding protein [Oceanicella actignis]SHN49338.1 putative hydroxymethylpyrimidine transport system substrate-binding protein [Oceanicella actignis]
MTRPTFLRRACARAARPLAAAALALGLSAAPAAAAAQRLTLALDWFVNPDHAPIIVAQQRGIFARHGLELRIVAPADPSDPPRMAAAGAADIAVSYQPQLHLQRAQDMPLRRLGTLVATPLNCLLVRADGPVRAIADLRGRRIGYSVAGMERAVLGAMLRSAGLSEADVELVNVNWSLSPSVMSGQVDAVIGAFRNFELAQMRLEGVEGRCFHPEEHGVPVYDELIYVANPARLDPEAGRRFLAAVEEATLFILNHPEEAWRDFVSYAPELDDALNRQAWAATLPRLALRPAARDEGRYARFEAFLHAAGLIAQPRPADELLMAPPAAPPAR